MNRKLRRAASRQVKAPSISPPDSARLIAMAMLHYESGELAEAGKYCREVLAREPNHAAGLSLSGTIARESGRNNAAFRFYAKALAVDGCNPAAHYNIALAHEALGDRDRAGTHFTRAIELGLDNPATLAKRSPAVAACLRHLANNELTVREFNRTNALDELVRPVGLAAVAEDPLFASLLSTSLINDIDLERFLTRLRAALLEQVVESHPTYDRQFAAPLLRTGPAVLHQRIRL